MTDVNELTNVCPNCLDEATTALLVELDTGIKTAKP
jgi:hypothetical protein